MYVPCSSDRYFETRIHLDWSWLRMRKVKVNPPSTCTLRHRLLLVSQEHSEQSNHRWRLYPVILRFHWRNTSGIKRMKFNYQMAKRSVLSTRIINVDALSSVDDRWSNHMGYYTRRKNTCYLSIGHSIVDSTVCIHNRECLFGSIAMGVNILLVLQKSNGSHGCSWSWCFDSLGT